MINVRFFRSNCMDYMINVMSNLDLVPGRHHSLRIVASKFHHSDSCSPSNWILNN